MIRKVFDRNLNLILENNRLLITPLTITHVKGLMPMCLNPRIWKYHSIIDI